MTARRQLQFCHSCEKNLRHRIRRETLLRERGIDEGHILEVEIRDGGVDVLRFHVRLCDRERFL